LSQSLPPKKFVPVVSAQIDFGLGDPHCPPGEPCGWLRNIAISADGDTALVPTDASDAQTLAGRDESVLILVRNVRAFVQSKNRLISGSGCSKQAPTRRSIMFPGWRSDPAGSGPL
jgi:hypothetical protein